MKIRLQVFTVAMAALNCMAVDPPPTPCPCNQTPVPESCAKPCSGCAGVSAAPPMVLRLNKIVANISPSCDGNALSGEEIRSLAGVAVLEASDRDSFMVYYRDPNCPVCETQDGGMLAGEAVIVQWTHSVDRTVPGDHDYELIATAVNYPSTYPSEVCTQGAKDGDEVARVKIVVDPWSPCTTPSLTTTPMNDTYQVTIPISSTTRWYVSGFYLESWSPLSPVTGECSEGANTAPAPSPPKTRLLGLSSINVTSYAWMSLPWRASYLDVVEIPEYCTAQAGFFRKLWLAQLKRQYEWITYEQSFDPQTGQWVNVNQTNHEGIFYRKNYDRACSKYHNPLEVLTNACSPW